MQAFCSWSSPPHIMPLENSPEQTKGSRSQGMKTSLQHNTPGLGSNAPVLGAADSEAGPTSPWMSGFGQLGHSPFNQQQPACKAPQSCNATLSKGPAIHPPKRIHLFGTWVEPSTANESEPLDGNESQQGGVRSELTKQCPSLAQDDLLNLKVQQSPGGARVYGGAKDPTGGRLGFFYSESFWKKKAPGASGGPSSDNGANKPSQECSGSGDAVFERAKGQSRQLMDLFGAGLTQRESVNRASDQTGPAFEEEGKRSSLAPASVSERHPTAWPTVGITGFFKADSREWVLTAAPPDASGMQQASGDAVEGLQRVSISKLAKEETKADATIAQAAHELMALASARADGHDLHAPFFQHDAFKGSLGPPSTTPSSESDSSLVVPIKIPSPGLISDDDQPLACRQGGSVHAGKNFHWLQRPQSGETAAALDLDCGPLKETAEVTTDDRCNYHSGKAKMGWRCKNPKLKGFKICKFHRKQRLDRRKQLSAAAPPLKIKTSLSEKGAEVITSRKDNLPCKKKPEPSSSIPRPPKKRPHVFVESSLRGSSEPEGTHPPKKKRSVPSPRERPDASNEARPSTEGACQPRDDGESAIALKDKLDLGALSSPVLELSDDKRCTYRSGAQGKWRCKRPRHESFKFCHFHRESQKKYWNKKNQARRLVDKK